jgi:hypothetical protein
MADDGLSSAQLDTAMRALIRVIVLEPRDWTWFFADRV